MTAEQDTKVCPRCGEEKSVNEFPWKKHRSGNRTPATYCRPCKSAKDLERYHELRGEQWFMEQRREQGRRKAKKRTPEQRRAERKRIAERKGKTYKSNMCPTEEQWTRLAESNAREAWSHWVGVRAPDEWVTSYWMAAGKPWGNPRISGSERYALRYQCDAAFRHKEIARSRIGKGKRRRRVEVVADGTVDEAAILAERKSCVYCGARLTDGNTTLDHMEPLSRGGTHSAANLVACCRSCNSRKGAKPFAEWILALDERRQRAARKVYEAKTGAAVEQIQIRWAG